VTLLTVALRCDLVWVVELVIYGTCGGIGGGVCVAELVVGGAGGGVGGGGIWLPDDVSDGGVVCVQAL